MILPEAPMEYEYGHCRREEMFDLLDLANRIFRADRRGDMGREYPLVFEAQNLENLQVARHEGHVVSHVGICMREASILGARLRVASIGAVGTDPKHRGHGIATRLMEEARARAVEQGASLMLISGHRGLYRRMGYVEVGAFQRYTVRADDPDAGYAVTELTSDDLPAIVRLYQAEPVRFFRPVSDWHKLLAAGMLMNRPSDLLVVRRGNAIVAYVGVQRPSANRPEDTPGALRIREVAGSRSALAAALPGLARRYGMEQADVILWSWDAQWRAEAAVRAWRWEPEPFPGTLGIIDPVRFLRAIRPLVDERSSSGLNIVPEGQGAAVTCRGERVVLSTMPQLTALVFGGETEEARALPELAPTLREATDEVFPLPLLWYGYNYV
jgi:predicted N-acetyltransferase YhbS